MRLSFLNRLEELSRLKKLLDRDDSSFGVLYGRRRCGKSRLLREAIKAKISVFYIGDDREAVLQRSGLASEISRLITDFDQVTYPEWDALFSRWWSTAPSGSVLILDELPSMVARAPEIPSLIQKYVDSDERGIHLLVAGSSQRMMQGLILDRTAPLYGRADEVLKIGPLRAGWIREALSINDPVKAVTAYAFWGGVPRYWELASDYSSLMEPVRNLVLDPLGVLHEEPGRLLIDDLRDTTQATSILSLIGRGCHRVSEIAGRIGKPATSLSRPLHRLWEMELITREVPFGAPVRGSKRTLYRISDPFLSFWFRFVEPNRSRLEARQLDEIESSISEGIKHHIAEIWEELARQSVPHLSIDGETWSQAKRWWGTSLNRNKLEFDLIAESTNGDKLLVGEVKWARPSRGNPLLKQLIQKTEKLPFVGSRQVVSKLWLMEAPKDLPRSSVITAPQVLDALL